MKTADFKHYSVMKDETIKNLNIKSDGIYVDATFGGGGHSLEIIKKLNYDGKLIAFDQDIEAIELNQQNFKQYPNFHLINDNFANLEKHLNVLNINYIDGIIYDLGVSSYQLDTPNRGFSYRYDAELDMRMNPRSNLNAKEIINNYSEEQLSTIFKIYGEEKHARKIAKLIVKKRNEKLITTTYELNQIISSCYPEREKRHKHPSKKVFQALRIEVNNELKVFENSFKAALKHLQITGRIVVISFHSLEDKIVMREMKKEMQKIEIINQNPFENNIEPQFKLINPKVKKANKKELSENFRSHSALLRIIERKY